MTIVAPIYPSSIVHEVQLLGAWVDISQYAVSGVQSGSYGITGKQIDSLVATPGTASVTLNNAGGQFSPDGNGTPLPGWQKNVPYRVTVTVGGYTTQFVYRVSSISLDDSELLGDRRVNVGLTDWLRHAASYPIHTGAILTNKQAHEAVTAMLALMPIQPEATDLHAGLHTFVTVFDGVGVETKGITEMQRLAASEYAPIYLKRDGTLVVESRLDRHGWRELSAIVSDIDVELAQEDDDLLLQEDGDTLLLDTVADAEFHGSMTKTEAKYADELVNQIWLQAYPREVAAALEVVYSLPPGETILLPAGKLITFRGNYTNPSGGNPINATEVVTPPTATTDFLAFANANGTGTNYTATLEVSAIAYSDNILYTFRSPNARCYITFLNARGKGIYKDNMLSDMLQDSASIVENGTQEQRLDQVYQRSLDAGMVEMTAYLEDYREQKTDEKAVHFIANTNPSLMYAFLQLDIGDLVDIMSLRTGVNTYAYIQKVMYSINPQGKPINFAWELKRMWCYRKGLSPISVEFGGGAIEDETGFNNGEYTDGIDFGRLPALVDQTQRTMCAWVYADRLPSGTYDYGAEIIAIRGRTTGAEFWVSFSGYLSYDVVYSTGVTAHWIYEVPFPTGEWVHVAVSFDNAASAPHMYVNGVEVTVTEDTAPSGTVAAETSASVYVGNVGNGYTPAWLLPWDGKIFDPRIYNRIVTASEFVTIYNSGVPDVSLVTDGLMFQPFAVKTNHLADYIDITLSSLLKVRDNVFGAVGTPNNAPVGRAPYEGV